MIKPELQKQILAYGNNLHPSQRGLFFKGMRYPVWKKQLFLLMFLGDCSSANTIDELIERLGWREEDKPRNLLIDFLVFSLKAILTPFVLLVSSPFYLDLIRAKATWHSIPSELLLEALSLGVMVDTLE